MIKLLKNYRDEVLVLVLFMALAILLNLQLPAGSNIHRQISGHDEYLTVRQVYNILEPASWKHFVMAVISGEKLYYGRVMFYMDAAVAYLPYQIWGLKGMVIAIRMTHALILILALMVLARTWIRGRGWRWLFYACVILGIQSFYFIMMPKPEPWQLLFLALFLYYWKRNSFGPGRHFFWLGLAYGAKFNVLFLVPALFAAAIYVQRKSPEILKQTGQTLLWWLAGLIVAIPCLILSPVKPQFFITYLEHTFLFGAQPDDDPVVNWLVWLKDGYGYYYWGFQAITWAVVLVALAGGLRALWKFAKNNTPSADAILFLFGAALFFPIILFTKRVWPHYLWEGHIFFLLLFIAMAQQLSEKNRKVGLAVLTVLFIPLVWQSGHFLFRHAGRYMDLDIRYSQKKLQWEKVKNYITTKKSNAFVLQDLSLWYPFEEFVKINRYHPFSGSLPEDSTQFRFNWELPENPAEEKKADYLVAEEILDSAKYARYAPEIRKDKDRWRQKMIQAEGTVWERDTVIDGAVIFRRY